MLRALAILLFAATASAAPLWKIADVRKLSAAEAKEGGLCEVEGVVTALDTSHIVRAVQDESGAVFITSTAQAAQALALGDRVRVTGRTGPGGFAPVLVAEQITLLGPGELPEPVRASAEELQSGALDCRWVEVEGVVRTRGRAWQPDGPPQLTLATAGQRLHVILGREATAPALQDAVVRVRGICTTWFNESRQMMGSRLRIFDASQITVLSPPTPAEAVPLRSIAELLQYEAASDWRRRVRVRGTVTASGGGHWLQVEDATRGLRVWLAKASYAAPGTQVEVMGFAERAAYGPQFADALVRSTGVGAAPEPAVLDTAKYAAFDGRLVRTEATLLELRRGGGESVLLTQAEGLALRATFAGTVPAAWAGVEPGARLALTGVCLVTVGGEREHGSFPKPVGCELLLREAGDIRLLAAAPWWTPERTLRALAVLLAVSALGIAWTLTVLRKNRELRGAQAELSGARDQLAQRVEVRTGQLQEQLAARQLEQAEFAAVNAERTRLARELHDSVEQALAGAAWQFEAASRSLDAAPEKAPPLLERAVTLLRRAQDEVRRSVWGLRALALERNELPGALRESLALLTDGTAIHSDLIVEGPRRPLPAPVEDAVLRITQEAIANALKHAAPQHILVRLDYSPAEVALRVQDDGRGFHLNGPGPGEGHFGLRDIRERATALGGTLVLDSAPGIGTTIAARIPAPPA